MKELIIMNFNWQVCLIEADRNRRLIHVLSGADWCKE